MTLCSLISCLLGWTSSVLKQVLFATVVSRAAEEEICYISLPNISIGDLGMNSIQNSREGMRKYDEVMLNCQLLDNK